MPRTINHRCAALLCIALVGANTPANAQSRLGAERADIGNIRGDIWSVWTSPARMERRDLVAVAGTVGAAAITSRIDSAGWVWMQAHDRTFVMRLLDPIRESAAFPLYELGSGQGLLPVSALLYVAGRLSRSVNLRDAGLGCAAGHISSLGLRQVVFRSVKRGRPKVTPSPFPLTVPGSTDWSWESFYSGHISNSMACASFLTHRYSMGLAEPLPYAFSLAIGLGRLADGHHWASDMVVGSVVGFAVGKAIADRQLRRDAESRAAAGLTAQRAGWSIPVVQWSVVF